MKQDLTAEVCTSAESHERIQTVVQQLSVVRVIPEHAKYDRNHTMLQSLLHSSVWRGKRRSEANRPFKQIGVKSDIGCEEEKVHAHVGIVCVVTQRCNMMKFRSLFVNRRCWLKSSIRLRRN